MHNCLSYALLLLAKSVTFLHHRFIYFLIQLMVFCHLVSLSTLLNTRFLSHGFLHSAQRIFCPGGLLTGEFMSSVHYRLTRQSTTTSLLLYTQPIRSEYSDWLYVIGSTRVNISHTVTA